MKINKSRKAFVPLYYFPYQDKNIPTHKMLKIKKFDSLPPLKELEKELSPSELDELTSTSYWLCFEYNKRKGWDKSNITILFLLALWLEVPTRTHAMHLFELSTNESSGEKGFTRCLDRFQWNKNFIRVKITNENLVKTFKYFDLLIPILKRKKRVKDALIMTVAGCMSYRWQIAYISFSSAVETLLTYEEGPGITNRLAKSYACLIETNDRKRNAEYRKFRKLYKIRSDIIHGRMRRIAKTTKDKPNKRLDLLADFSDLLRNLWKRIITDKSIVSELEKGDTFRKYFFDKIVKGYNSPKIKK